MSDLRLANELLQLARKAVTLAGSGPHVESLRREIEEIAEVLEPVCRCGEPRAYFLHEPADTCEGCKCPRDHHEFAPIARNTDGNEDE